MKQRWKPGGGVGGSLTSKPGGIDAFNLAREGERERGREGERERGREGERERGREGERERGREGERERGREGEREKETTETATVRGYAAGFGGGVGAPASALAFGCAGVLPATPSELPRTPVISELHPPNPVSRSRRFLTSTPYKAEKEP